MLSKMCLTGFILIITSVFMLFKILLSLFRKQQYICFRYEYTLVLQYSPEVGIGILKKRCVILLIQHAVVLRTYTCI